MNNSIKNTRISYELRSSSSTLKMCSEKMLFQPRPNIFVKNCAVDTSTALFVVRKKVVDKIIFLPNLLSE